MTSTSKLATVGALVGLVVIGICLWSLNTSEGVVTINGTELNVLVAEHALAQKKGLGGYTEETLTQDGMLFVFADSEVRNFWMKGMKMNLDVLWIGNGRILVIDRNVQAPYSRTDEPEMMTSSPLSVDMVLELPAGSIEKFGLVEGMTVTFTK
jgi:uncharacterized membrane protein (UPF0127 family)